MANTWSSSARWHLQHVCRGRHLELANSGLRREHDPVVGRVRRGRGRRGHGGGTLGPCREHGGGRARSDLEEEEEEELAGVVVVRPDLDEELARVEDPIRATNAISPVPPPPNHLPGTHTPVCIPSGTRAYTSGPVPVTQAYTSTPTNPCVFLEPD